MSNLMKLKELQVVLNSITEVRAVINNKVEHFVSLGYTREQALLNDEVVMLYNNLINLYSIIGEDSQEYSNATKHAA